MSSMYVLDNNVLTRLGARYRKSALFVACCRFPTEVLYEARDAPYASSLKRLELSITVEVLVELERVMLNVRVGEFRLVDLYHNEGNADPLIVATCLDQQRQADEEIFGVVWDIVSDDKAVRELAEEFRISWLSTEDLTARIEREEDFA